MLDKLPRNAVCLYTSSAIRKFAALALAMAISRSEDASGLGVYCFALVLAEIGMRLVIFGTDVIIVRDVSAGNPEAASLVQHTLGWRALVSLLVCPALVLASFALGGSILPEIVSIMAAGVIAGSIGDVYLSVIQGRERFAGYGLVQAISSVLGLVLALWALQAGLGLRGVAAAYAIRSVFLLVCGMLLCRLAGDKFKIALNLGASGRLLRTAAPVGLNRFVTMIYLGSGLAVLGRLHDSAIMGQFAAPMQIFEACTALGALTMTAAFPTISRLMSESPLALKKMAALLAGAICWAGIPLSALVALQGDAIVRLVFGAEFPPCGAGMALLMAAVPLSLNFVLVERLAYAAHDQRRVLVARVIGLAGNLLVLACLVPAFGCAAAAAGVLAAEIIMFLFLYPRWKVYVPGFRLAAIAAPPMALGLVSLAPVFFLARWANPYRGLVFSATYVLIACLGLAAFRGSRRLLARGAP